MAKSRRMLLAAVSLLILAVAAQAQTPEANRYAGIAPFVDDQAMLVAHLDLDRVAAEATANWLIGAGLPEKETPSEIGVAFQPLNALKRTGAREIYAIFSPAYLPQTPVVLVVPLTAETNEAAVAEVLKKGLGAAENIRGAVCAGHKLTLEKLRAMKPIRQPLLEQAFAHAGDGALQVAAALTADQRRVVEETMPELPPEAGGGPSKVLTRGLLWLAVSADLSPNLAVKAVAQCQDQKAAADIRDLVGRLLGSAGQLPQIRQAIPNYSQIVPMLTPKVAGDTLTLSLQQGDIDSLFKAALAPAMIRAREAALAAASSANVHNMLLGCLMYAKDHNGEWPQELKHLLDRGYLMDARVLSNPLRPDLAIGYVYRKPDKDAPPQTVVIYEQPDPWPAGGVNVGFVDGVVMQVKDQEQFKQMLEKGR